MVSLRISKISYWSMERATKIRSESASLVAFEFLVEASFTGVVGGWMKYLASCLQLEGLIEGLGGRISENVHPGKEVGAYPREHPHRSNHSILHPQLEEVCLLFCWLAFFELCEGDLECFL